MIETIHPVINDLNAPFWAAAAGNRLALPYCVATRQCFWPPSPISPFPGGGAVEWRDVKPVGTLRTQVVYRRAFQKAFEGLMPYGIGLVALDAGPRLFAHVVDPDAASAPRVGERVSIDFVSLFDDGPPIPTISASRRAVDEARQSIR